MAVLKMWNKLTETWVPVAGSVAVALQHDAGVVAQNATFSVTGVSLLGVYELVSGVYKLLTPVTDYTVTKVLLAGLQSLSITRIKTGSLPMMADYL